MNIQLPRENWCRILLLELIRKKISAKSQQNIAVKAVQRNCCRISQKILLRELPRENCCRSSPKILLSKPSREIAAKYQQNIAAKAAQRKKMGRFLAKPKQPRQQEPTPSQSQLLSSEILINYKSRHQKDLLTFEYTIILTLYYYIIINES